MAEEDVKKAEADLSDAREKKFSAEAERIALDRQVIEAEKHLASLRAERLAAAKPAITEFSGFAGNDRQKGLFTIYGENLGNINKMGVQINGHTAEITAIRPTSIKGLVPYDVKPGPITVTLADVSFKGRIAA